MAHQSHVGVGDPHAAVIEINLSGADAGTDDSANAGGNHTRGSDGAGDLLLSAPSAHGGVPFHASSGAGGFERILSDFIVLRSRWC